MSNSDKAKMLNIDALDLPKWYIEDANAVYRHPDFRCALRLFAQLSIAIFHHNRMLVRIVSEEARYMIGAALLALCLTRDPLDPESGATLTKLRLFSSQNKLSGPNRVSALVALMVHSGYLRQVSVSSDRRVKRLELTERGLSLADSFTVAMLRPLQLLSGKHRYEDLLRTDMRFMGNFYAEIMRLYADGARFAPEIPGYSIFSDQNGGREILFMLWLALTDGDAAGNRIVSCSYGEIARSLGVSRGHVRRLIETAESNGLLVIQAAGGRSVELLPQFIELVEAMGALEFALVLRAADAAASNTAPDAANPSEAMPPETSGG